MVCDHKLKNCNQRLNCFQHRTRSGAGRKMVGPPTSPYGRVPLIPILPPSPRVAPIVSTGFPMVFFTILMKCDKTCRTLVLNKIVATFSSTAPAHPHATRVAMYSALFNMTKYQFDRELGISHEYWGITECLFDAAFNRAFRGKRARSRSKKVREGGRTAAAVYNNTDQDVDADAVFVYRILVSSRP